MQEKDTSENENQEILENLSEQGKQDELVEMFEELPTPDVVDFLEEKTLEEIHNHLLSLDPEDQGRIFSDLNLDLQLELFRVLNRRTFAKLFGHMYSDIRADLYQNLSKDEQIELMPYLERKVRENVMTLSSYPPETAGGIMTTDFVTVFQNMNATEALKKVREEALIKDMIYYLYVVDDSMVMKGLITLKQLVLAKPQDLVQELIQEFFVYAEVNEDRESVAQKIEKYDLAALPVLNTLNQLVGIVSYEEAMDVIRAEQTEDIEKFMGIMPSEEHETYLSLSTWEHFKKRVLWLVGLAAIGIISGMIINEHRLMLEQFIVLAMYMPMMAATGGNTGSQAATVVIRSLSLGEISEKQWLHVVFKEARISFMLSVCVALLTYVKIAFLSFHSLLPSGFTVELVGFTIALAISIQVISSAVIGAGLPLIVRRLGGDAAVVASPAITTIVDITGLLIYFFIATGFLGISS